MKMSKLRRAISLVMTVLIALGMVVTTTGEVNAASGKIRAKVYSQAGNNKVYVGEKGNIEVSQEKGYEINILPIRSVKVSNKSVARIKSATVTGEYGEKYKAFYVVGKKPGKVTLSIKYKLNGKVKTKKRTVTVKAAPNAIQSLEINGSKKSLSGEKAFVYSGKCTKTQVKAVLTPAEGWEIGDAYGYIAYKKGKTEKTKWINSAQKKITDGTAISFPKKYTRMLISVSVEKEGKVIEYEINLHR